MNVWNKTDLELAEIVTEYLYETFDGVAKTDAETVRVILAADELKERAEVLNEVELTRLAKAETRMAVERENRG